MDIDKISLNSLSNENLGLLKAALSILVDHVARGGAGDELIIETSALARVGFSEGEFFQISDFINKIKGSDILGRAAEKEPRLVDVVIPGLNLSFGRQEAETTYIRVRLNRGASEVLKSLLLETILAIDMGLARNGRTEEYIVISDTPEGTTWSNMRFQFTGRHSLHVSVKGKTWAKDNMTQKDFGLEKIDGKSMTQWVMLQALSKNDGKFPLTNFSGNKKETKRRQLTDLAKIFHEVFPNVTGGRALRPTADGSGYECAFILIPEQSGKNERTYAHAPDQDIEGLPEQRDEDE